MDSWPRIDGRERRALLGFALVFIGLAALRVSWVCDDAYITFRTVENLVNGWGPLWNLDERVQTYPHPLWLALMTTVHFATGEFYFTAITLQLALTLLATGLLL